MRRPLRLRPRRRLPAAFTNLSRQAAKQITTANELQEKSRIPGTVTATNRFVREGMAAWSRNLLVTLGARHPDAALHAFMAFSDGIVLHRLSVDPDLPVRPSVAVAVHGCLAA